MATTRKAGTGNATAPTTIWRPGAATCRRLDSPSSAITTARAGCRASSSRGSRARGARAVQSSPHRGHGAGDESRRGQAGSGDDRAGGRHCGAACFKARFALVFGEISHQLARTTCERLIALAQESDAPISVLISSPGGHVESADAIHDIIRFIRAPVTTVGAGWVASAGTHIFLAAPKERRVCLPNTRFMIHQPGGGAGGPATDIAIQAKEILRTRERIARV